MSHATGDGPLNATGWLIGFDRANSTADELSCALTEVVSAAELFGCKPSFWRWAADAASLLGRSTEAGIYRKRFIDQA
jgi:hypothetical protein